MCRYMFLYWFAVSRAVVTTYRPANLFLPIKADGGAIRESVSRMNVRISSPRYNTSYVVRDAVVETDSDDVLFDALCGSRTGRVSKEKARSRLSSYGMDFVSFERDLFFAQMSVLVSQTLYVSFQLVGIASVLRVLRDLLLGV